jgi:hypothetical protein
MALINVADKIYLGSTAVSAVYAGTVKVWPVDPKSIAGLTVWLDASQLGLANGAAVSPWPDMSGLGNNGAIVGTPPPTVRTNALNGMPVVRFTANQGMVRGNTSLLSSGLPNPGNNFTVIYVARWVGPAAGRILGAIYPAPNCLVGFHNAGLDSFYDNGWIGSYVAGYSLPSPWVKYGYTGNHNGTNYFGTAYKNGLVFGTKTTASDGFQANYALSGLDASTGSESSDAEVAEFVMYNRTLTGAERITVETYFSNKWGV